MVHPHCVSYAYVVGARHNNAHGHFAGTYRDALEGGGPNDTPVSSSVSSCEDKLHVADDLQYVTVIFVHVIAL